MDKLGLRGVVTGIHQYSTERRIAGPVLTVKLGIDEGQPTAHKHLKVPQEISMKAASTTFPFTLAITHAQPRAVDSSK